MIRAGKGYVWKARRFGSRTDFELHKLIFGFIPPLGQTYHTGVGFYTFICDNDLIYEKGKDWLLNELKIHFKNFQIEQYKYDVVTKIINL